MIRTAEGDALRERPAISDPGVEFDDFYRDQRDRLFRALVVLTRNTHEAEELAQDAFAVVWQRWSRVRIMRDPEGYVFRVALNAHYRTYRRVQRAARHLMTRDELVNPSEAVDAKDQLERAILRLPSRQRAALIVTELLGYDSIEAGRIMQVRPGTVRRLASKARQSLKQQLEREEEGSHG